MPRNPGELWSLMIHVYGRKETLMSVPPVAAQGGQLVPRGSVVFDLEIHDAEGYAALPPRWPGEHFWLPATSPKAPKVL
jgi:hypothetical protein